MLSGWRRREVLPNPLAANAARIGELSGPPNTPFILLTAQPLKPITAAPASSFFPLRTGSIMIRAWPSSKLKGWRSPTAFIRRRKGCGRDRRAVPPAIPAGRGGPRHRPAGRAGRVRGLSRAERGRQDHHAQAALRRDHAQRRHGPRDGLCALAARKRLPPPLRPGDGPEEPALVGPAGRRVVPPAPADLPHRAGAVRPHPRRADRPAGRAAICWRSRSASCRWASG